MLLAATWEVGGYLLWVIRFRVAKVPIEGATESSLIEPLTMDTTSPAACSFPVRSRQILSTTSRSEPRLGSASDDCDPSKTFAPRRASGIRVAAAVSPNPSLETVPDVAFLLGLLRQARYGEVRKRRCAGCLHPEAASGNSTATRVYSSNRECSNQIMLLMTCHCS